MIKQPIYVNIKKNITTQEIFTLKKDQIILVLFGTIPIFYQFFNLVKYQVPFVQYVPLVLLSFLGIVFYSSRINLLFKGNLIIIVPVIINFLLLPIFSFNLGNFDLIIETSNIVLRLIALIGILVVIATIREKDLFFKALKYILVGHSIVITAQIFLNFNQLIDVNNYSWITSFRTTRADFGFSHWNTAGLFFFTQTVLLSLYYMFTKNKFILLLMAFYSFCILPTGNRTALFCLVIFLVVYQGYKLITKFHLKFMVSLYSMIVIAIFILFATMDWDIIWSNSSGRDFYIMHNLQYISNNGLIWFGIGPVNNNNMSEANPNILVTDNWFVSNTILYGIFGTVIFIFALIILFWKYFKTIKSGSSKLILWGMSFFITMIFYNMFESLLYVPGYFISLLFWILMLSILKVRFKPQDIQIKKKIIIR